MPTEPITDAVPEDTGADTASLDAWATEAPPEQAAAEEAEPVEEPKKPAAKAPAKAPAKKAPSAADLAAAADKAQRAQNGKPEKPAAEAKPTDKYQGLGYNPEARVKVVVDGEEVVVPLGQVIRDYRKGAAADRRFQEAARLAKEAEGLKPLEAFKGLFDAQDIEAASAALKAEGLEVTPARLKAKIAERIVLAEIEREKLEKENPAELKRREAEAEVARLKRAEEERKAKEQETETERKRQAIREDYNRKFSAALSAHALPATPYTVMRMATLMQENLRMGLDLAPEDIAPLVKEDLAKEQAATIAAMTPEQAVKLLPKAWLDGLRKYDLAQVKSGAVKPPPPPPMPGAKRPPRPAKFTNPKDAERELERWVEGR